MPNSYGDRLHHIDEDMLRRMEEERLAAAQSFLESLEQLEDALENPAPSQKVASHPLMKTKQPPPHSDGTKQEKIDIAALEDAAADIERFMQSYPDSISDDLI